MASDCIDRRSGTRERRLLLDVARRALVHAAIQGGTFDDFPPDAKLLQRGGVFVTLRRRGRLRGCIGQIATELPLVEVVAHCAAAAGRDDPRFPKVKPEELAEIKIELSLLTPAVEILPNQIEIGRHGLIVTSGRQRGVLLPQVAAQYGWTAERFLQETCEKAGLDRGAWKIPGTRIEAFTAEIFSETQINTTGGKS